MRQCGPNRPATLETRTRAYRLRDRSLYTNQRGYGFATAILPMPLYPFGTGDMISARYPFTADTQAFNTLSSPKLSLPFPISTCLVSKTPFRFEGSTRRRDLTVMNNDGPCSNIITPRSHVLTIRNPTGRRTQCNSLPSLGINNRLSLRMLEHLAIAIIQ
jgi:hypothetical protein